MNKESTTRNTKQQPAAEFLLFLIVSVVGVYSLGQGLGGVFEPGQGINLLWLAVTGVAMMVLFAQMGRVHDTWPRRRKATNNDKAQEPQEPFVQTEER
jgi:hypothetical protein